MEEMNMTPEQRKEWEAFQKALEPKQAQPTEPPTAEMEADARRLIQEGVLLEKLYGELDFLGHAKEKTTPAFMAQVQTLWNKYKAEILPTNSAVVIGLVEAVSKTGLKIKGVWYNSRTADFSTVSKGVSVKLIAEPYLTKDGRKGFNLIPPFEIVQSASAPADEVSVSKSRRFPKRYTPEEAELVQYATGAALDRKLLSKKTYVRQVATRAANLGVSWPKERIERMCDKLFGTGLGDF